MKTNTWAYVELIHIKKTERNNNNITAKFNIRSGIFASGNKFSFCLQKYEFRMKEHNIKIKKHKNIINIFQGFYFFCEPQLFPWNFKYVAGVCVCVCLVCCCPLYLLYIADTFSTSIRTHVLYSETIFLCLTIFHPIFFYLNIFLIHFRTRDQFLVE